MQEEEVKQRMKPKRIRRSKEVIERELLLAITKIITDQGFNKLTINNISEVANVTKRVIYENYDSFDKLLEVYFIKNDFWTSLVLSKIAAKYTSYREFVPGVLKEFYKAIDENPVFQCIIRWEIASPNNFVRERAKNRELSCADELERNRIFFQRMGIDIEAIYAILIAGIYYLVLRKDVSSFCGIDTRTKEGKERIFKILDKISEFIFSAFDRMEEKKRIIMRLLNRGMEAKDISEVLEVDETFVYTVIDLNKNG